MMTLRECITVMTALATLHATASLPAGTDERERPGSGSRPATTAPATDAPVTTAPCSRPGTRPGTRSTTRAATRPVTRPTTWPATRPATRPAPEVMSVLRGLERACRKHASIRAEMFYRVMNLTMGDQETRTGWVAYRRKGPGDDEKPVTRFRIHFDTVQLDSGPVAERKVDFAFDGERLTIARHRIEQITRYRLGPGARRPVTIGEGPFPLPFGQRAAEMIEYFRITTAETRGRLAHTKYLKLVPRKDHATRLNVSYVKMWVDEKTWLPVKIESADKKDNRTLLVFRNVRTDVELPDDLFRLPTPDGWHETVENLGEADSLAP